MSKSPEAKKRRGQWCWWQAMLAVLVFLNLIAIAWYFFQIPDSQFDKWKKVVTVLASWLGTIATTFGIKKYKKKKTLQEVVSLLPVRIGIVISTLLVWFFVLPFHSVAVRVETIQKGTRIGLSDASVFLKKQKRGITDAQGFSRISGLAVQPQVVYASKPGYQPDSLVVSFWEVFKLWGSPVRMVVQPARGVLHITSEPSGAAVFLDSSNASIGLTPLYLHHVVGRALIQLQKSPEFRPADWQAVEVVSGDTTRFHQKLIKYPVLVFRLRFMSQPEGAFIFVDDNPNPVATTNDWLEVSEGPHRFRLHKEGFEDVIISKTITRDMVLSKKLTPLPN